MVFNEVIKEYLEYNFGGNVKIQFWDVQKLLPIYLSVSYRYFEIDYLGENFLIMDFSKQPNKGIGELKKHIEQVRKHTNYNKHIVVVFSDATNYLRNKLIEEKISFIVPGKQLYIPFLGVIFSEHRISKYSIDMKYDTSEIKRMTPSAQSVLLELLIFNDFTVTQDEIAKRLGLTKMSVSRAFKELKKLEIFSEFQNENKTMLKFNDTKEKIWDKVKKHFSDPKQKVIYIKCNSMKNNLKKKLIQSGESALSEYTMLAAPKYETYCITKKEWDLIKEKPEIIPSKDNGICILEIWKYKIPTQFGCVHPLGLAISLASEVDERIQGELEDLLGSYDWGDVSK